MLRLALRLIGVLLLAGAFAALIIDGTRSIAADALRVTSFGGMLQSLLPGQAASLRPWAERVDPRLWDPVLVHMLAVPDWALLAGFGLVLFAMTQRRRPQVGYAGRRGV